MQKLPSSRGSVRHLTFSPDGDILAGLGCNALYCWTRSRDWEKTGLSASGPITGLAFHPGGRSLAYAVFESATASPPPRPTARPPSVWHQRFAREKTGPFTGILLYSLASDGFDEFVPNRLHVPLWGPELDLTTWARGLAFTPDGFALLAGQAAPLGLGPLASVYHWHFTVTDGVWHTPDPVAGHGQTENGRALVGNCLALAGPWGVAVCPIASTGGLFVPNVASAGTVAVAARAELMATCTRGSVAVWNLRAPDPVAISVAAQGGATALALAPDGSELAIGHPGGTVSVWDPRTGHPGPVRDFGIGPVTSIVYAPDGLTLAVAGHAGAVVVDTD
jgi:WD40 repeat protein